MEMKTIRCLALWGVVLGAFLLACPAVLRADDFCPRFGDIRAVPAGKVLAVTVEHGGGELKDVEIEVFMPDGEEREYKFRARALKKDGGRYSCTIPMPPAGSRVVVETECIHGGELKKGFVF